MKPAAFEYHAPESVDDAVGLLSSHEDAKVLAGGQSLVPMMSFRLARPATIVDINGISDLDYIQCSDGVVQIGATARQSALEESCEVAACAPLLAEATGHVGHRAIRNRGTLAGSLAHNDPASEYPAVLMALGASVTAVSSGGSRVLSVEDLVSGHFLSTALGPDEMITEVSVPAQSGGHGFAEFARRHGDFAVAGVAAVVNMNGSGVASASIAAFGGTSPARLDEAESALVGSDGGSDAVAEAAARAASQFPATDDIHGSADYRRALIDVLTRQALQQAIAGAQEV
ncbi:MAG: xanthine dehydrogenase family protein subunit M [bacterium]|nr:xanthine dehydrogenase family protein subunit M [bacterium]